VLVATEMHCRIRGLINVRLSSVGSCKHDVISGLDQGHHWNDGFVKVIPRGAGAAALDFDAGSVGTEYKNSAFCHFELLLLLPWKGLSSDISALTIRLFHLYRTWRLQCLRRQYLFTHQQIWKTRRLRPQVLAGRADSRPEVCRCMPRPSWVIENGPCQG